MKPLDSLRVAAGAAALLACLCVTPAQGQPAGALGDDFIHIVRQGDTLMSLTQAYVGDAARWTAVQAHNGIDDPRRLPVAQELRIPLAMIPQAPAPARVSHLRGQVQLNSQALSAGAVVPEGGVITTAADGFATLSFIDGSQATIQPQSRVVLQRARRFQTVPLADSVLDVEQGEIEADVAPGGSGVGRFEVRAPVAVTGVRGTRLRVGVEQGVRSEVLRGSVRLQPHAPGAAPGGKPVLVAGGYGAAVSSSGDLLGVQRLLPAPQLGEPVRADGGWTVPFEPLQGAVGYVVRVSRDPEGMEVVFSARYADTAVRFTAPAGRHYVTVRAIDAAGLAGHDAAPKVFEGAAAVQTAFGLVVTTQWAGAVQLTSF